MLLAAKLLLDRITSDYRAMAEADLTFMLRPASERVELARQCTLHDLFGPPIPGTWRPRPES